MSQTPSEWRTLKRGLVALVAGGCCVAVAAGVYEHLTTTNVTNPRQAGQIRQLRLSHLGIDYYGPSSYYQACPNWTWLETRCWDPRIPPQSSGEPGEQVLRSDLSFVHHAALGRLMRIWASANQLFQLSGRGRFTGLNQARVRNLDTALAICHHDHLQVDLVLFAYSEGTPTTNEFNPAAIDGSHPSMRRGYLQALRRIIVHLGRSRVDAATVRIIDLQDEPYYQLEQYFSTPDHLTNRFAGCKAGADSVSSQCVDRQIVHPWLISLYRTARAASHRFLYTESDTGRLLSTDAAQQEYWMGMYPADIYDIHMYDSRPWLNLVRWRTALNLPRPWISGEVGCASGDSACTYDGSAAARIDGWWLKNLPRFGAQSLLVESKTTLWYYRYAIPSQTLTATGRVLQCRATPGLKGCTAR